MTPESGENGMNALLDKMNLRPNEKRLIVAIFVGVFIVLNYWMIWPRFNDWSKTKDELAEARVKLLNYETKIANVDTFKAEIEDLKSQGSEVLPRSRVNQLTRLVDPEARKSGVTIWQKRPQKSFGSGEGEFFDEEALQVVIKETGDKELIDFLINLGLGDTMIRVRDMTLKPNANNRKLEATLTLVASYEKSPEGETEP